MSAAIFPSLEPFMPSAVTSGAPSEPGASTLDHWASHERVTGEKETFASEAVAAEYLLVDVAAPRPTARGRLAMLLDGAVERALDACGAPPPALTAGTDFDGSLDDLLRRAEVSGCRGLAVWIPSLASVVSGSVLDPVDSAAMRAWIRATRDRPVK